MARTISEEKKTYLAKVNNEEIAGQIFQIFHNKALALPPLQVPPCLTVKQFLEIETNGAENRER